MLRQQLLCENTSLYINYKGPKCFG